MPTPISSMRRVAPGQPMPLDHNAWNKFVEAESNVSEDRESGALATSDAGAPTDQILVKNPNTSRTVGRGEVVVLDDLPLNVDGDKLRFRNQIAFKSVESTLSGFGRSVISPGTVLNNRWGQFAAGGVMVARIYGIAEHHWMEFADVNVDGDDVFRLQLHPSGSWQVLYHDLPERTGGATPEDREQGWAYVRFNGIRDRTMWGECVTDIPAGGAGTFAPWVENQTTPGYKTDSPLPCSHSFFVSSGDVTSGQKMRAQWNTDLKRWELVDAEC